MAKTRVLTVDDEEHILELLKYNLESNGYEVIQAEDGEKAIKLLETEVVDIVLLDLMLPGIDGIGILKAIRLDERLRATPVIMLTAKTNEIDKVLGLEMGADDYIGKPFGVHELMARMKAVLRRTQELALLKGSKTKEEDVLVVDELLINRTTHEINIRGQVLELPLKEFELLYLLAKNKGRVFDREYLLEKIWGYDYYGETRTVDVHIRNIRVKIEEDDKNPKHIKTVRGVGYKFV